VLLLAARATDICATATEEFEFSVTVYGSDPPLITADPSEPTSRTSAVELEESPSAGSNGLTDGGL
jgi:hypothetical protein